MAHFPPFQKTHVRRYDSVFLPPTTKWLTSLLLLSSHSLSSTKWLTSLLLLASYSKAAREYRWLGLSRSLLSIKLYIIINLCQFVHVHCADWSLSVNLNLCMVQILINYSRSVQVHEASHQFSYLWTVHVVLWRWRQAGLLSWSETDIKQNAPCTCTDLSLSTDSLSKNLNTFDKMDALKN